MNRFLIFILGFYRKFLSPSLVRIFGNACRFTPSCSEYTIEALKKYGFIKGILMGIKRLGRCHPLGGSGFDPVK